MAKLTPGGKKRYSVTLTPANVERFQELAEYFGMPPAVMSRSIDDFLQDMCSVLQSGKEQGKLDISDIFRLMGKQMELRLDKEEAKNGEVRQKRSPNSR